MNRRTFLSGVSAAPLISGQALGQDYAPVGERPPNILFLLFDKCRTDAIGAYDERDVHTPNLDFLAETGVRFNNCYAPQALCGPTRASILTGSYSHVHGLKRNVYPHSPGASNSTYQEPIIDPFRDQRFRLWDNFAFYLNNAGYATGHIGKWHLGPANPGFFDYWKSFNSLLLHWIGEPHQSRYRPDVHTDQGLRFLDDHDDEPFFLYQSYYSPHEPSDPPKHFLKHYEGQNHAGYYGSVSALDWNVGRILDRLREKDVLDDTMIIFTTEHGRAWTERPGSVEGMTTSYDDAARIPLMIRYPKRLPSGKVWQSGVSSVDLMPTILDAAGIVPIMGAYGNDFRPVLHGRSLFEEVNEGRDDWSRPIMIQNVPQQGIDNAYYEERGLRTEQFKIILRKYRVRPVRRPGELYDMKADPAETRNLWDSARSTVKEMASKVRDWGEEYDDDLSIDLGTWAMENA